uniref:Uncharacterized protein n=1 Tax=Oryza barthii TaxID=65489 RepID=A0A0D3HKY4_9ORYZ
MAAAVTGGGGGGFRRWLRGGWSQRRLPSFLPDPVETVATAQRVVVAAAPPHRRRHTSSSKPAGTLGRQPQLPLFVSRRLLPPRPFVLLLHNPHLHAMTNG